MSTWFTIGADLWINYSVENLDAIVKKGYEIGFNYVLDGAHLSIQEATQYLINTEISLLTVKFEDTVFDIGALDKDGLLSITFSDFGVGWQKKHKGLVSVPHDLQRYAKLLLDLVSDYQLWEFTISYV